MIGKAPPRPWNIKGELTATASPQQRPPGRECADKPDPTWPLTDLLDRLKDLVLLIVALLKELGMLSLPEFQTPFKLQFLQHLLFLQEYRPWGWLARLCGC